MHDGEVVNCSLYWLLTIEEISDEMIQLDMLALKDTKAECLQLIHNKLEEVGTPDISEYISYADKGKNQMKFIKSDDEIMPSA